MKIRKLRLKYAVWFGLVLIFIGKGTASQLNSVFTHEAEIGGACPYSIKTSSIHATGIGIGTTEKDHCLFLYRPVEGNFEIIIKLEDIKGPQQMEVGLIARKGLDACSEMVGAIFSPTRGSSTRWRNVRDENGQRSGPSGFIEEMKNVCWLKLVRTGSSFREYASADGKQWGRINNTSFKYLGKMPSRCLVGITVSSGSPTAAAEVRISDIIFHPNVDFEPYHIIRTGPVAPAAELYPVGAIKPQGWLLKQMRDDLEHGFVTFLDQLAPERFNQEIFARRNTDLDRQHFSHGYGEYEGNWMNGLVRMAFLTHCEPAMKKAEAFYQKILDTMDETGYIGIYTPQKRFDAGRMSNDNGELFTQEHLMSGMLAYYELSGRKDILNAVIRAVNLTMDHYSWDHPYFKYSDGPQGSEAHGICYVVLLDWLYRLTGDERYIDFAVYLYEDYNASFSVREKDIQLENLLYMNKGVWGHTAHYTHQVRVPLTLYYLTGDPVLQQAGLNAYKKLFWYLLPSGVCHGDEFIRFRQPNPAETYFEGCSTALTILGLQTGWEKTGSAEFADRMEVAFYNGLQGFRLHGDKCGIAYFTKDTRSQCRGPRYFGGREKLTPSMESLPCCCLANYPRGITYFIQALWGQRETPEGIPVIVKGCYAPNVLTTQVEGASVSINEQTEYPFSDQIRLIVQADIPLRFDLLLRRPEWAAGMTVTAEGALIAEDGNYFRISKTWTDDEVQIVFRQQIQRKYVEANSEWYYQRGPLVYVQEISSDATPIFTNYPLSGYAEYTFKPKTEIQTILINGTDQLQFKRNPNADVLNPWVTDPYQLEILDGSHESLVPMGGTVLRKATFGENK